MADDEDDAQKTEDPTPKKMEESRKKGQVPMSKEVNTWVMLSISAIIIAAFSPGFFARLTALLRVIMEQSWQIHTQNVMAQMIARLALDVFAILTLPLVVLFVAAVVGPFAQIGPLLAPESIKPKLSKLSIIQGFGRLFSKKSLFEFVKGVLKVVLIAGVSVAVLYPYFAGLDTTITLPMGALIAKMLTIFIKLMIAILTVLAVLAMADLLFQRYVHMQEMRMSKQEIKDEYKQTEGDPHVKSRLRQLRMEKAQNRMMGDVPDSSVVITNPTHFAIALKYEPDENDAPICVAKGQDLIALKIREVAKEADVVIVENPPLARTLFKSIEIGQMVPPDHYQAVAEVISYVFSLKKRM